MEDQALAADHDRPPLRCQSTSKVDQRAASKTDQGLQAVFFV
jgi:hypothetical protein